MISLYLNWKKMPLWVDKMEKIPSAPYDEGPVHSTVLFTKTR